MNFKPTTGKVIYSIILAIIISLFFPIPCEGGNCAILPNNITTLTGSPMFYTPAILCFVILLIILYVIWSLIQSNKRIKKKNKEKIILI